MTQTEKAGNAENKILEIRMLGDFTLRKGDRVLSGEKMRGKQIWTLLEYIMVNRHKEISMDGLVQTLWQNDEAEDPANALKNLAYRLRTALKQALGSDAGDYIVCKHGAYAWNEAIPCRIDTDEMEAAYKESKRPGLSRDEQLLCCKNIIALYKGNFMPQASFKEWVVPPAVYYQRIYMETVALYSELLLKDKQFKEAEELCRNAIAIDPFVEDNHATLIKALVGMNNQERAIEHYNYVHKLFYDELGVKPSETITSLYKTAGDRDASHAADLSQVKNGLKESSGIFGAIYCNYEEFKMIYRLEARAAKRSGKSIFIALLTVRGKADQEMPKKYAEESFEQLKEAVVSALRRDDVVTRHGRAQFLLMLANLKYEDANMVLGRIVSKINATEVGRFVEVTGELESLEPIEMEEWHATFG